MKEGLFLLGAFLITFFMGFFICLYGAQNETYIED